MVGRVTAGTVQYPVVRRVTAGTVQYTVVRRVTAGTVQYTVVRRVTAHTVQYPVVGRVTAGTVHYAVVGRIECCVYNYLSYKCSNGAQRSQWVGPLCYTELRGTSAASTRDTAGPTSLGCSCRPRQVTHVTGT